MSACTCSRFAAIGNPCRNEAEDLASLCLACRDRDCEIEAPFGGAWEHVAPVGKRREPLPEPWSPSAAMACPRCGNGEFLLKPDGRIICADDDCYAEFGTWQAVARLRQKRTESPDPLDYESGEREG